MDHLWFFLSHAGRDDLSGPYVGRFYRDLAQEVASCAGLATDIDEKEIGFIDRTGLEPGDHWQGKIDEQLRICRTLVCLVSRSFLRSPNCAKELQLFKERVDAQMATQAHGTPRWPLILPILWDRPDRLLQELPSSLSEIQVPLRSLGSVYAEEGLGYLMRLNKHADDYQELLVRLARRLVEIAEKYPLEPTSVLHPLGQAEDVLEGTSRTGPSVARFVFVAGHRKEFAGIRQKTDFYGWEGGRDWRPYLPDANKSVGILSQEAAAAAELYYESLGVSDELVRQIRLAEETNTIVLLLVDPWSIRVQRYRRCMLEIDQLSFINCGLLISWNEADEETSKNYASLRAEVRKIFERNFIISNLYFKDRVRSQEELKGEIVAAIGEIRRRMMQRGTVFQMIEGAEGSPVPVISGTAGART